MASAKTQRIGIWIIIIFMSIGTIGSFAVIILSNKNSQSDQKRVEELSAQYQKDQTEYQTKVDAQAKELSGTYFSTFSPYASRAAAFDAASVTELKTEDLTVGTGDTLTDQSSFTAYYIGWDPEGKTFDSSVDGQTLKAPISVTPGGVIEGWTKGVASMKVGGIRELTIPSSLAYGETGSGDTIKPNTPLKFVVMVIPTPTEIVAPTPPQELVNYYQTGRLQ